MKKILSLLIICWSMQSFAQKKVDNQFNSWTTYSGNHKIGNQYSIHTLYSLRKNEFLKNWQQSLLRIGLNYQLNDHFILTAGYDWVENFSYGKQPIAEQTTEQRIFEQIVIKNSIGRVVIEQLYKLEQRFIGNGDNKDFEGRFRYNVSFNIPLNHNNLTDKTWFISGFNEIFINLGQVQNNYYFNQNWTYLGLGYKVDNTLAFKVGYMNQYFPKADGLNVEKNHTLMLNAIYNMDFTKKNY